MTRRKIAAAAIVLAALLTGCHAAPHCNYAVYGAACVRP